MVSCIIRMITECMLHDFVTASHVVSTNHEACVCSNDLSEGRLQRHGVLNYVQVSECDMSANLRFDKVNHDILTFLYGVFPYHKINTFFTKS